MSTSDRNDEQATDEREDRIALGDELLRLRDEFVSLASHELMTPMTSLKLQAQQIRRMLSREAAANPEQVASMLEVFERQIGRLAQLCDKLLQAVRIPSNELLLQREDVELGALVRDTVSHLVAHDPAARDALSIDVEDGLFGSWDREQLESVVRHLIHNALTFGGGKPVAIAARRTPFGVELVVRDHGVGIAKEDQERIFERFERACPAKNYGGLGLGLYIARAIVRAHQGSIRVDSEPGQGATFTIELPAVSARGAAAIHVVRARAERARTARRASTGLRPERRAAARRPARSRAS